MSSKTKIEIEIKVDNRLFEITKWILFFTQPLWYLWRDKIWEWLSTGKPIPLIRYKLPYDKQWKWFRSSETDKKTDSDTVEDKQVIEKLREIKMELNEKKKKQDVKKYMIKILNFFYRQQPINEQDKKDYIKAIKNISQASNAAHFKLFNHFYDLLSILDNKATSLLTYNSIVMAIIAWFHKYIYNWVLFIIAVLFILSSILLISVIWVHWSTKEELNDIDKNLASLLIVTCSRTVRYRLAWACSFCTILLLSFFAIIKFFISILGRISG